MNTKVGRVVKTPSAQTITVLITTYKNHPLYKKRYIYSKKYLVHDAQKQAQVGDEVLIAEGRPVSKRKCWYLEKIISSDTPPTKKGGQS